MIHTKKIAHLPLLSLSLGLLLTSCSEKSKVFELKGQLTNTAGQTLVLEKFTNNGPVVVDSTVIGENGEFEFSNYSPRIGFYRVKADDKSFAMLVLDSSDKVNLTGDYKDLGNTYKTQGSDETTLFVEYNNIAKRMETGLDSMRKAFELMVDPFKMDSVKVDSVSQTLREPYMAIVRRYEKEFIDKIKQNASRYSTLMAMQSVNPEENIDVYLLVDENLSKKFPNDFNVKVLHDNIQKMRITAIGQMAPDIVMPAADGKTLSLSSLRGKVVLIDFWASWCKPCRAETPNVAKAYAKYKDKGFEIYGVSLDQEKERWLEAVAKDKVTWLQVCDGQPDNEAARKYNVESIPFTLLLDREGKIIAKNLRGPELEKKLAEVFN